MSVCELSDWLGTYSGVLNKEQFVREGVKFVRDIHGGAGISEENLKVSLSKMYAVPSRDPMADPYISAIFSTGDSAVNVAVFRGEHGDGGELESRGKALSFGSRDVATIYAISPNVTTDPGLNPRILETEVTIYRPVINQPDDPFLEGADIIKALGVDEAKSLFLAEAEHLGNTDNFWEIADAMSVEDGEPSVMLAEMLRIKGDSLISQLYIDAYVVFDNDDYVQKFINAGFDGVVHGGNGMSHSEAEYKVFSPSQVKINNVVSLKSNPVTPEEKRRLNLTI